MLFFTVLWLALSLFMFVFYFPCSNMRWDTLAQTLSFSGVFANAKVLVFESCLGLVTGAVAYRMRGHGSIVAMYPGQQPHNELVGRLNLDEKSTGIIEPVSSGELTKAVDYVLEHGFLSEEQAAEELAKRPDTTDVCRKFQRGKCKYGDECRHRHVLIAGYAEEDEDWTGADGTDGSAAPLAATAAVTAGDSSAPVETQKPSIPKKFQIKSYDRPRYERSGRQPEELVRNQLKLRQGFSSFILASKFHPLSILQSALKLLLPSSSFVIFCEYMEPLLECFEWLHGKTEAIELMMADTWLREYQTLPGRYHPLMSIPASGGYLLSGIYLGCNVKKPVSKSVAGVVESTTGTDAAAV
jgi:tRNA (adenine58-N1)-methyltransferase non-catalytic subunit